MNCFVNEKTGKSYSRRKRKVSISLEFIEFWDKFLRFRIRPLYPKLVKIDDLLNGLDVLFEISNFTPTLGFTGIPHLEESVCH